MTTKRRRRRNNPLVQLRKPWNVKPGVDDVREDSDWSDVGDMMMSESATATGAGRRRGCGVFIEVRPFERGAGEAEIAVYVVEMGHFNAYRPGDPNDTIVLSLAEEGRLKRDPMANIEWTREHATTIIRGETRRGESIREAMPSLWGWRDLLRYFRAGWSKTGPNVDFWREVPGETPVFFPDAEHDGNRVMTLDEACMTEEEREVFHGLRAQALGEIEYLRENEDAFDNPFELGLGDAALVSIAHGDRFVIEPGQRGYQGDAPKTEARERLLELFERILPGVDKYKRGDLAANRRPRAGLSSEQQDFVSLFKELGFEIKHHGYLAKIFADGEAHDRNNEFVFYTYENGDVVDDEVSDELGSKFGALREESRTVVGEALAGVRGPENENFDIEIFENDAGTWTLSFDPRARWLMALNVDEVVEWAEENLQSLAPRFQTLKLLDEDDDADDEPEENPSDADVGGSSERPYVSKKRIIRGVLDAVMAGHHYAEDIPRQDWSLGRTYQALRELVDLGLVECVTETRAGSKHGGVRRRYTATKLAKNPGLPPGYGR